MNCICIRDRRRTCGDTHTDTRALYLVCLAPLKSIPPKKYCVCMHQLVRSRTRKRSISRLHNHHTSFQTYSRSPCVCIPLFTWWHMFPGVREKGLSSKVTRSRKLKGVLVSSFLSYSRSNSVVMRVSGREVEERSGREKGRRSDSRNRRDSDARPAKLCDNQSCAFLLP